MRVLVAGATGAIGRPLVPLLSTAGHEVIGLTRSAEKAEALRLTGAEAVVADALDAAAVERAVADAAPDVVVHQLTALPDDYEPRALAKAYPRTSRLRREGTRNLLAAARACGAKRVVAQSIAFIYAPEGDALKDETARPWVDAPQPFGEALAACLDLERQVTEAGGGLEGVVLRYGFFYGPATYYARDGSIARQVLRRRLPVVGGGDGVFSHVHVDDAAAATVAAVEGGATGVYNVVDDDPAPMREWLPLYAEALGAPRPLRVPAVLARLVAGRATVEMATVLRGASNAKARTELGWTPRWASWRTGFREGLENQDHAGAPRS